MIAVAEGLCPARATCAHASCHVAGRLVVRAGGWVFWALYLFSPLAIWVLILTSYRLYDSSLTEAPRGVGISWSATWGGACEAPRRRREIHTSSLIAIRESGRPRSLGRPRARGTEVVPNCYDKRSSTPGSAGAARGCVLPSWPWAILVFARERAQRVACSATAVGRRLSLPAVCARTPR